MGPRNRNTRQPVNGREHAAFQWRAGGKAARARRRVPDGRCKNDGFALRRVFEELERIRSGGEDPILKANSLDAVKSHLQALWELVEGNPDSEAFEEMVNVLQIAVCVECPEALTQSQVDAIWSVLVKMNDDPDVNDQAANDLTQELIEGGVDVFREIG